MKGLLPHSRHGAHSEQGAVAIIVALSLTALLIITAMVLDFGLARLDRQANKSAADDAVAAGIQGFVHGDDGKIYSFSGVCAALSYLQANLTSLSTLQWPSCNDSTLQGKVCNPSDSSTWADFSGTADSYSVRIESPYTLPDPAFPEDSSLSSLASDTATAAAPNGTPCDQLAVIITQTRKPSLGSIATSSDLITTVRSVGRVDVVPGDRPPALLLLDRTNCGVLVVGSSGSPSRIAVKGVGPVPGTIHSDSDASGSGCGSGSNQQLFQGNQADGIMAYAATSADPFTNTILPGSISSVAKYEGKPDNVISDGLSNVYGTSLSYPNTGTSQPVVGRDLVTRKPVDKRYLAGVTATVRAAYSQWTLSHSSPTGYQHFGCPTAADMTTMAAMSSSSWVYIDCPGSSGITLNGTIGAGHIFFHGYIKGGVLDMPNAQTVYVDDTDDSGARINGDAIVVNNNNAFCLRTTHCDTAGPVTDQCDSNPTGYPFGTSAKAQLLIRRGRLNGAGTSSLLRLCNTTVIMESGQLGDGTAAQPGGCLPTTWGTAPTPIPCPGASTSAGTSQINTSGRVDWTAPNAIGSMATLNSTDEQALWDGGEDLALWTESYGGTSNPTFAMSGGGAMHVSGVFMAPNAAPFQISGSGAQDLTNAQYVVSSFTVGGGATLTMGVDQYNGVPPGKIGNFTLVR